MNDETDRADDGVRAVPDQRSRSPGRSEERVDQTPRDDGRGRVIRYRALVAFAFFGAAFAWALHLMVSQMVSEWSYFGGEYREEALDVSIVVWAIAGATVVLLGIAGGSLVVAARLRRKGREGSTVAAPSVATVQFAAAVGLLSGIVFLLVILAQALPLLFFPEGT